MPSTGCTSSSTRAGLADGRWVLTEFDGPDTEVPLPSVQCALPLAEIYDKVEFVDRQHGDSGSVPAAKRIGLKGWSRIDRILR